MLNDDSTATLVEARKMDTCGGDEGEYLNIVFGNLSFKDDKYKDSLLSRLNTLRRNREMCDVVLLVGQREIFAHKAVLAAISPVLFDLLSPNQQTREDSPTLTNSQTQSLNGHQAMTRSTLEREKLNGESQMDTLSPVYLEFGDVDFDCFEALINYAYSGNLEISSKKAADLYKTSSRFRMQSCAEACARYLVKQLSPQNCIGIRKCANRANDVLLANKVDLYIQKYLNEIIQKSKQFLALPFIQVEVVLCVDGRTEMLGNREDRRLAEKVLDWLQQQVHELPEHAVFRMEIFTQKVHMLYLDDDQILQDCRDMDDHSTMGCTDLVQDYKKYTRRNIAQMNNAGKSKGITKSTLHATMRMIRFASTDSMNSLVSEHDEVQWKIIAIDRTSENYYTALSVVRRQLAVLTVHLVDGSSLTNRTITDHECASVGSRQRTSTELTVMQSARCSVGAVCSGGKLVVCGGYDRGECLRSVEEYDPVENRWTTLTPMNKERGRFDATVVDNMIYAVAGSDGTRDLECAECYDPETKRWTRIEQMKHARSNHGVSSVNGFVYAVGGCQGQKPVKQCERYDPATNTWTPIAQLQHARYQAGCCSWSDRILAVSGCDTWNCINSVECYDATMDTWHAMPALATARRGCGVGVLKGKLYVIGGSDGVHSLLSVEMLDLTEPQATWRPGPSLNTPRGNVRAVVVPIQGKGDVLFAVGGFNGKSFLNSIEWLEDGANEWKTSALIQPSTPTITNRSSISSSPLSLLNRSIINEDPIGESE